MKLLFDLIATQSVEGIKNHGGAEYTKVIFSRLLEFKKNDIQVDGVYNKNENLDEEVRKICIEKNVTLISIGNRKELEQLFIEKKYDKFYSGLGYSHRKLKVPLETKFISVVHGLRPIEMVKDTYEKKYIKTIKDNIHWLVKRIFSKKYYQFRKSEYEKFILENSTNIVVVSKHTKNAMLAFFPKLKGNDIKVFYSPEKLTPKIEIQKKENLFLMVSAGIWLKNSYRGIMSLDKLFDRIEYKGYNAIILGGIPEKIKKEIRNINNFKFMGYVSTKELEELYAKSRFLFYPTLNEGFGYPPLEAMKYKTPVIASSITAIPEICGDAAVYFNPFSIEEMTTRLIEAMTSDYEMLQERAYKRYLIVKQKQDEDLDKKIEWILN